MSVLQKPLRHSNSKRNTHKKLPTKNTMVTIKVSNKAYKEIGSNDNEIRTKADDKYWRKYFK